MQLQYEIAYVEPDITVVRLLGRLITRLEGRALDVLVRALVQRGQKKLIFDLCGIEELGSMACQFLLECWSTVQREGGGLRLASANPKVVRICRATRLDTMLPFYSTVTAAATHFELQKHA